MTGSEGTKHTQRMLASGTTVVGGVNPKQGRPDRRVRRRRHRAGVRHRRRGHRRDRRRRVGRSSCRRRSPRPPSSRRSTPRSRWAWSSPRASPVHDTAEFCAYAVPRARPASSARTAPADQPRGLQRGHHPGRHHRPRPHRPGLQVGHADLPDHVRAARLRLLHRGRHRRRPGHRHHAHRLPCRPSRTTRTPTRS